jgi:hypothetical protein
MLLMDCPATIAVELLELSIEDKSEVNIDEVLTLLAPVNVLGSPVGTQLTPGKKESKDKAAAMSGTKLLHSLTTEPTSYLTFTEEWKWTRVQGLRVTWVPEARPVLSPGQAYGLTLSSSWTPGEMTVQLTFREIG